MVRFFRSGVLLYVAAKNPDVQKQQEQKRCRLRFHASASHGLGLAITMARPVTRCDAAVITQMFWIASLTSSIRDPDSVGSLIDDINEANINIYVMNVASYLVTGLAIVMARPRPSDANTLGCPGPCEKYPENTRVSGFFCS